MEFDELLAKKHKIEADLRRVLNQNLKQVAAEYLSVYGIEDGLNHLGEDLCTDIAPLISDKHWSRLARHIVKISS